MRVLAVTNLYPNPLQPHRAPFNRHQLRLLGERHPVRVIAPVAWTDEWHLRRRGDAALPADRRADREGLTVEHPRYYFPPKLGRRWYGHCFARSIHAAFRRALAEFRPDIVFAPWVYPDGWAAVRLARAAGLPAVVQAHGSDVLLLDQFPARKARTAEAVRLADGVVAVSGHLAAALADLGADPNRTRVIYDGVDPDLFRPGDRATARSTVGEAGGAPLLLFVGNLVPVKAVDVLLDAATILAKDTDFRLAVVGAGPLLGALERRAADAGLAPRVRFVGAVDQAALPDWYKAADVFVLPSHSEGVPNVLLEASACGTPWVASRVGGIPEIAHFGRSRLTPPNRPAELAAAIRATLAEPPPAPPAGPRPRREAVAELEQFLASFVRPAGAVRP